MLFGSFTTNLVISYSDHCSDTLHRSTAGSTASQSQRNRPNGVLVQRLFEIGDQVVGVLDAQRDAGEAVADRITPAGAPVH